MQLFKDIRDGNPHVVRHFITVLVIAFTIPVTLLLARESQDTRQYASEVKGTKANNTDTDYKGYIVEFRTKPTVEDLPRTSALNKTKVASTLNVQKSKISNEHANAKKDTFTQSSTE